MAVGPPMSSGMPTLNRPWRCDRLSDVGTRRRGDNRGARYECEAQEKGTALRQDTPRGPQLATGHGGMADLPAHPFCDYRSSVAGGAGSAARGWTQGDRAADGCSGPRARHLGYLRSDRRTRPAKDDRDTGGLRSCWVFPVSLCHTHVIRRATGPRQQLTEFTAGGFFGILSPQILPRNRTTAGAICSDRRDMGAGRCL